MFFIQEVGARVPASAKKASVLQHWIIYYFLPADVFHNVTVNVQYLGRTWKQRPNPHTHQYQALSQSLSRNHACELITITSTILIFQSDGLWLASCPALFIFILQLPYLIPNIIKKLNYYLNVFHPSYSYFCHIDFPKIKMHEQIVIQLIPTLLHY